MKAVLNILIIVITLLALPLQGFAASLQPVCAPAAAAMEHCGEHGDDGQPGGKASLHAGCCVSAGAAAMAPATLAPLPADMPLSEAIPFLPRHFASVHLALLERPPRH